MKKWILILSLLICLPIGVCAKDGISNYYIDLTVEKNGDITVEELFVLEGNYNGYERIINYKGSNVIFDGSLDSFNGSDIYNGTSIEIQEVKSVQIDSISTFADLKKEGTHFSNTKVGTNGMHGVYTIKENGKGQAIRIYNPSSKGQKGFYIKYVITNMAIIHKDIAEVGFNLFTEEQLEPIDSLEMHIHLPGNQQELRAWGHGPLWGETKNISMEEIELDIKDLKAKQGVDIRFVFDKDVVLDSQKESGISGLSSILTVETKKANEANRLREHERKKQERERIIQKIVCGLGLCWFIGLWVLILYVYYRYDKEYKNEFPSKYFREFPAEYGPEIVGYLLHKQISNNDLSASILNLICKKAIGFEEVDKKDYKLINLHKESLTSTEKQLVKWLFDEKTEIKLSLLKKQAQIGYEEFLKNYTSWKQLAKVEGESYQFYEQSVTSKVLSSLYSSIGLLLGAICLSYSNMLGVILMVAAFISFIYFLIYKKRTKEGNLAYHKWIGLRNFMIDFGTMDEKELPEIVLWEKYLAYAVSLGCADKLAKTMELKVKMLNEQGMDTTILDLHRMHVWMSFQRSFNQTITSSISAANSAKIAGSSNSSSGGFGGGFSGGGGSFGGGGGGGRF